MVHVEMPQTMDARRTDAGSLRRYRDRGVLGGVCAGLAQRLQVNVSIVRITAAALVGFGGIGIALYALAWGLIPVAPESIHQRRRVNTMIEVGLLVVGLVFTVMALRTVGAPVSQGIIWPAVLGVCGLALVWRPIVAGDEGEPLSPSQDPPGGLRRPGAFRLIIGALLVAFASAGLLHHFRELHSLGRAVGAVAIVATIGGFLVVPWFVRLVSSLNFERSARIREQERAEVAAHLHDSVLQTLALIQKRSGNAREVATLARRQERELRRWLLERPGKSVDDSFKAMLERVAAEVEELHGVPIEAVIVGDGPLDVRLQALVQAAREALTNAAKFAGSERVDLYAEIDAGRTEVFVRDRGVGFDPEAIPVDRRGVRDSIIARMNRHGGRAAIQSAPGQGTEVQLLIEAQAT